jgi:hypothetical protein
MDVEYRNNDGKCEIQSKWIIALLVFILASTNPLLGLFIAIIYFLNK